MYASGTKFPDQAVVREDGISEQRRPGFANNAFIFPGVALGALASGASAVTDEMFSPPRSPWPVSSPKRI